MGNSASGRRRVKVDEQFTRLQGLYPEREQNVDGKKLRRLILEGKLAPCYPGVEDAHPDVEECPICFLHYPSLNRSRCCTKGICTECFLQMKSPMASRPTQCPFCKTPGYAVEYRGPKDAAEKGLEQAEEQQVIMATLRMRQEEQAKAEERAKKREKDLAEGRVPEPPSPTLFPPPTRTQPAFPPPAATQPPQGVNGPPQSRNRLSPPVPSDQGSADRVARRRSSLNRRVTAIEPDNLWFRAGSAQGSRRAPAVGEQEASDSSAMSSDYLQTLLQATAESQATHVAPPGTASASDERAEDSGEGAMPILRALARSGPDDLDMDLDDVMLNEAIWLSIQEEEDRQRRSSQGNEPMAHVNLDQTATGAPEAVPQSESNLPGEHQTQLQTQGYEDPDEAATSELARAIAASLEESATWQPGERTVGAVRTLDGKLGHASSEEVCLGGSEPALKAPCEGLNVVGMQNGAERKERRSSERARNGQWPRGALSGEEPPWKYLEDANPGTVLLEAPDKRQALGDLATLEPHADASREASGLVGVTSQADVSSGEPPRHRLVWHSRIQEEGSASQQKEESLRLSEEGGASALHLVRPEEETSEARESGDILAEKSEGLSKNVGHVHLNGSQTGGNASHSPAERNSRLPTPTQLHTDLTEEKGDADSVSRIEAVEPLSLTQLLARKSQTGRDSVQGPRQNGRLEDLAVSKSVSVAAELLRFRSPLDDVGSLESSARTDCLQPGCLAREEIHTEAGGGAGAEAKTRDLDGAVDRPMEPFLRLQPAGESASFAEQVTLSEKGNATKRSTSEVEVAAKKEGPPLTVGARETGEGEGLLLDQTLLGSSLHHSGFLDAEQGRARSLNSFASGSLETPALLPVKYPPPRAPVSQGGVMGAAQNGTDCQPSLKRRISSIRPDSPSKTEQTKSTAKTENQTGTPSNATYEEQLARAIALSLAEKEAGAEQRKQHEAFEKEAFALATSKLGHI